MSYILKFFFVSSIYVCSCSTPSFSSPANSSPANSAIPLYCCGCRRYNACLGWDFFVSFLDFLASTAYLCVNIITIIIAGDVVCSTGDISHRLTDHVLWYRFLLRRWLGPIEVRKRQKAGPPTNPASAPPQKFLSLLRYNLFIGVNKMRVKISPLLCRLGLVLRLGSV